MSTVLNFVDDELTPLDEISNEFASIRVDANLFKLVRFNKILSVIDRREHIKAELFCEFGLRRQNQFELLRYKENFVMNVVLEAKRVLIMKEFLEILAKFSKDVCFDICEDEDNILTDYNYLMQQRKPKRSNLKFKINVEIEDLNDPENNILFQADNNEINDQHSLNTTLLKCNCCELREVAKKKVLLVYKSTANDSRLKKEQIEWFKKYLDKFGIYYKDFQNYLDASVDKLNEFDYIFLLYDIQLQHDMDEDTKELDQDSKRYKQLANYLYTEYFTRREKNDKETRFRTFLIDNCEELDFHWLSKNSIKINEDENDRKLIIYLLKTLSTGLPI